MMKGTLCLCLLLCTAATLASASYDDLRGKAASRRLMQHGVGQSVTFARSLEGAEDLKNAASRHPLLYSFEDDDGPDDEDDDGNDDDNSWGSYSSDDGPDDDDSNSWGSYSSDDGPDDDGNDDDNSWGGYSGSYLDDDGPDDDGPDEDDDRYVFVGRKLEGAEDLKNAASRHPLLYSFEDDDGPDDEDDDGNDDDNSWGGYSGSYSDDDGPDDDDSNSWGSYSSDDGPDDDDSNSWGGYSNDDGPDDDGPDDDSSLLAIYGRKLKGMKIVGQGVSRHPLEHGADDGFGASGNI